MRRETRDTFFLSSLPLVVVIVFFYISFLHVCLFVFCTHCDTSLELHDSIQGWVLEGTLLGEFSGARLPLPSSLQN